MLNVALLKLMGAGAKYMLPHRVGVDIENREAVLKLVSEAPRAAALIKRGARLHAAHIRLIKKRAV
jgi:hypothetical protein